MSVADFAVVRFGGGVYPDVLVYGQAPEVDSWDREPTEVVIRRASVEPAMGDLFDLRRRILRMDSLVHRYVTEQQGKKYRHPMQRQLDLCADLTSDPSAVDLLPWTSMVKVMTGQGIGDTVGGVKPLGRLDLLAHMKSRMSRGLVKVEIDDPLEREALRSAMLEMTSKPPTQEQDGLGLVDLSMRECLALGVSVVVWQAFKSGAARSWGRRDVSKLALARGA